MRTAIFCWVLFLSPVSAFAAVTFSEVAWMGSVDSANHEWIELHNDGEAISVEGWALRDGMNLDIALTGVVPANSYVVLERTSEDSAPGTAFLLYTGALVNTGATLSLVRADESIEDQVSGGENWQNIGGDNVTKETAQYTSGGWVTAAATPGRAVTAAEVEVAAANAETKDPVPTTVGGGALQKPKTSEPVVLTLPDVTLQLAVIAQSIGYVHQPIKLSVVPSGIGDSLTDSLQYEWNFGDGMVGSGKETTHVYDYPGTYVVTVYGGFKRQEQVARHEITILPVTLSLTSNAAGDVQVNNDSPYEIDLSLYRIKAEKEFIFPPRTIMLPGQTITIPREKVKSMVGQMVAIYDTELALVASNAPKVLASVSREVVDFSLQPKISVLKQTTFVTTEETPTEAFSFVTAAEAAESEVIAGVATSVEQFTPTQTASTGAASLTSNERWPYVALAVVLLLATLGVYAAPRRQGE